MSVDLVTVSSKGQIVLPQVMRNKLSIKNGDKLAVYASDNIIMLKPIQVPTADEFSVWLSEAQEWAQSVCYTESDVDDIIKSFRTRKRNENSH